MICSHGSTPKSAAHKLWLVVRVRSDVLESAAVLGYVHRFYRLDFDDGCAGIFRRETLIFGYDGGGREASNNERDGCNCT